jgi:hypothetical protein
MTQLLQWIESAGGPLLFASRAVIESWHGIRASAGSVTDYERTCAVTEEIGVIQIGSAQALVLGDEPDRCALVSRSPTYILMVRWRWAESEESLLAALDLERIERLPWKNQGFFRGGRRRVHVV